MLCFVGLINGAQAIYKKEASEAVYFHCSSHCLNLALTHASSIPPVKNMMGTLTRLGLFFKGLPKRQRVFADELQKYNDEQGKMGNPTIQKKKVSHVVLFRTCL